VRAPTDRLRQATRDSLGSVPRTDQRPTTSLTIRAAMSQPPRQTRGRWPPIPREGCWGDGARESTLEPENGPATIAWSTFDRPRNGLLTDCGTAAEPRVPNPRIAVRPLRPRPREEAKLTPLARDESPRAKREWRSHPGLGSIAARPFPARPHWNSTGERPTWAGGGRSGYAERHWPRSADSKKQGAMNRKSRSQAGHAIRGRGG